jgi:hypothetical protein
VVKHKFEPGDGVRCGCDDGHCTVKGIYQRDDGERVYTVNRNPNGTWYCDVFDLCDARPRKVSDEELTSYTKAVLLGEVKE